MNILVDVKANSGNNAITEGLVQMSYLLEISGAVMNNEDNAFTRNESKTCETGMSNVPNRDIIDETYDTLVDNNCIKKNNDDNRNSWIRNATQNITYERCVYELKKDIYL